MATYLYLVSDGKHISTTSKKPCKVKIVDNTWYERFKYTIGRAVSIYTDEIWIGTIGVYDISVANQVESLAKDVKEHSLALAARRIKPKLYGHFGNKASEEVMAYRLAPDEASRKSLMWSGQGSLLFNSEEAVNEICIQGK